MSQPPVSSSDGAPDPYGPPPSAAAPVSPLHHLPPDTQPPNTPMLNTQPSNTTPMLNTLPSNTPSLDTLPSVPVEYHQMLRTPRARWWKGLLVIVCFVAAYVLISVVLQGAAVAIDVARGRLQADELSKGKLSLTPTLLLSVNLTNAACIPIAMLLQWAFYGQRPRWLHSVTGRFRWRLLGRAALVVVPVWVFYVVLIALVAPESTSSGLTGESVALLVIVVLTTPLQAAGEEYGARGLITRAASSWLGGPRASLAVGTVVSSVIFMLAHGAGDPWLIVFYFLFGVGLSLVTWRTGGLEVAVLIHTVNNMVAFGIAILSGENLDNILDRSNGTGGPAVLVPMVLLAIAIAGVWWSVRGHLSRTFEPDRLAAPVPPAPPAQTLSS